MEWNLGLLCFAQKQPNHVGHIVRLWRQEVEPQALHRASWRAPRACAQALPKPLRGPPSRSRGLLELARSGRGSKGEPTPKGSRKRLGRFCTEKIGGGVGQRVIWKTLASALDGLCFPLLRTQGPVLVFEDGNKVGHRSEAQISQKHGAEHRASHKLDFGGKDLFPLTPITTHCTRLCER